MRWITLLLCLIVMAGCQSLQGDDVPATMRVELDAYSTEAAQINSQALAQRTQAAATIAAAGTLAADYYHYNNVLLATVRAVIPATPPERLAVQIDSAGGGNVNQVNQIGGMTEITEVGIASTINPDNSCAESLATQFNINQIDALYLASVAATIQSGTRLESVWEYNGEIVFRQSWIAQASATNTCVWLSMTSSDAVFQPGSWSASLFVNEALYQQIPFEMVSG